MLYDNKEKQKELFDEFKTEEKSFKLFKGQARLFQNRVFVFQLSLEKTAFLFISAILILVVSFCVGIERGKRIVNITKPPASVILPATKQQPDAIVVKKQTAQNFFVKTKSVPATNIITKTSSIPRKGIIYTIRIASYTNKKLAADETSKIRQIGFPAYVKTSGKYYLICVGDYMDKKQADAILPALKNRYGDGIYIKTSKNR